MQTRLLQRNRTGQHSRDLGDEIGVHNISAYNYGIMGYRTPNIDRIAKEGALFTDWFSDAR